MMANLSLVFSVFSLIFVFKNENVEAISVVFSLLNNALNALNSIVNNVQLPVKSPLPPIGTTSCSTYPHADKGVQNFQKLCYTQLFLQPNMNSPYKCRKSNFTLGLPIAEVPLEIPKIFGFVPQAGFAYIDYVAKDNTSQHFTYNISFVEAQTAELTDFVTNLANITVTGTAVITNYTDKGFVILVCPISGGTQSSLCSSPSSAYVCTWAQFPTASDVKALADPLNAYPFYFGKSLQVMDQTGC